MIQLSRLFITGLLVFSFAASTDGATLYVSKLGDGSDGSSWAKAFKTINAALHALPDSNGGHRVILRPDTYMESNLDTNAKGAPGAYNILEADFDGSLGSGRTGYAVIDSSDTSKGLKSVDWWTPFHAEKDFPSTCWDRWTFRHLYTTGAEAGMGWDVTADFGAEFSVIVEDCFGIGRAFGGLVGGFTSRPDEPIIYRRCQLWCLDWWGDAAGAYVRCENPKKHDYPDVIYEDCTLVGPDNALQAGNPGYSGYTRVKLKDCRLVSLNYSQPRGTPSTGIIFSTIKGEYLHVDLEDCILMGYKVFGAGEGEITYTTKGSVSAYVQFEQSLPEGFLRLGHWPLEAFHRILPPVPPDCRPVLTRESIIRKDMCEVAPILWKGRFCLMECVRPGSGGDLDEYYLTIRDAETDRELARFAEGHGLASVIVYNDVLYAFASRYEPENGWNDVTVFSSADLKTWDKKIVIKQDDDEHLFNSSVCKDANGFAMSYESSDSDYPAFTVKFARSKDLLNWNKVPDVVFGSDRYTACPCIRYTGGKYYMMYLERDAPRWFFETFIARSDDLKRWELAGANPVLTPKGDDESINVSDPDIVELDGKTYLYYSAGDQRTWMNCKRAVYDGSMQDLFESYFETGSSALSK